MEARLSRSRGLIPRNATPPQAPSAAVHRGHPKPLRCPGPGLSLHEGGGEAALPAGWWQVETPWQMGPSQPAGQRKVKPVARRRL